MNIKRVFIATALAIAGSAFATPKAFAAYEFSYFDKSKVPALSFASQSRQRFYNWDIYVRYEDGNAFQRGSQQLQSIYSVPDSKWKGPDFGNSVAPVPEPQTYALMIAGLLAVFMVARRRRDRP